MSYENPIDTRIVQIVLDDLEDNNNHTVCQLLGWAYGIPAGLDIPETVMEEARWAAYEVLNGYREKKKLEISNVQN